uniref:Adenosine monophosphate-protein transferase n=1 Tax=candidate division WOR-3 bacterium TaxID=2052148 RepID=A0A7C4CB04_UNCW3
MELKTVPIQRPENANVILGQSHFIKTIEDIHEALVSAVPGIRFGLAFCEASGPCLVRHSGTDPELEKIAAANALSVGAGHSFIVILGNAFPINVLNAIKAVPEVCSIFCATANPIQVVIAESGKGRAILGVIDGESPGAIENDSDIANRRTFLRKIGYKA